MLLTRALECGDAIILMSRVFICISETHPTRIATMDLVSQVFVWLYGRGIVRTPQAYYTGADYTIWG